MCEKNAKVKVLKGCAYTILLYTAAHKYLEKKRKFSGRNGLQSQSFEFRIVIFV